MLREAGEQHRFKVNRFLLSDFLREQEVHLEPESKNSDLTFVPSARTCPPPLAGKTS
jgi:hypothetical protein